MLDRVCKKCGEEKPLELFSKNKGCNFGRTHTCNACKAKRDLGIYYSDKSKRLEIVKKSRKKRKLEGKDVNKPFREYSKRNPQYKRFYASQREKRVKLATPKWLTDSQKEDIKRMYFLRDKMADMFGLKYHVDHIVPLRGVNVCGLNVPWNLQILESSVNLAKSNKLGEEL
jgi:hypothetical protein